MHKKDFDGFYGLRFIAICLIILPHLFTFKDNFGLYTAAFPVLWSIGQYALAFFFVASSFLITYLLLAENERNGFISLRYFFLRRILRIWPAYFLLLVIVLVFLLRAPFFHIPYITDQYLAGNYQRSNLLYFIFLPHLASFYNTTTPYLHHTYTIGIEEQFYFLWGILFYFFRRHLVTIFILCIIAMPLLYGLHAYLYAYTHDRPDAPLLLVYLPKMITYLKYSRLSTFAIGAVFGYAFFYDRAWINYFKRRWVQLLLYAVLAVSIALDLKVPYFEYEYYAFIAAFVMLAAAFPESLINYSARWLVYLGHVSYGIYLFHLIAMVIAIRLFIDVFQLTTGSIWETGLLCLLTLGLSVFMGWLSYYYFESFFLRLKNRFKKV